MIGDGSVLLLVWHQDHGGANVDAGPSSGAHTQTWEEFIRANPDIEPYELSEIWNTIENGGTYRENLDSGGYFAIQFANGRPTMKKNKNGMTEDAMAGATAAGGIVGSPNAFMTVKKRVGEEQEDDKKEEIVEFVRNNVPYHGKVVERCGKYTVVDVGSGRKIVVETGIIGPHAKREMAAMRSPTTPNKTMQKFVGAEAMGGAFEAQGDEQQGPEVDEVTAPSYWASALVNGDFSGLEDNEVKQVQAFIKNLAKDGWFVVSTTDDEPRYTNNYHIHNYGGDPKISGGEVIDYIVHRKRQRGPATETIGDPEEHKINTTEAFGRTGGREYTTWQSWKRAIKLRAMQLNPQGNLEWIGDKDIGEAHLDGKSIGEWDGVKGIVYGTGAQ